MAAAMLAEPGTKAGPCIEPCDHPDCRVTRDMASCHCEICGGVIGYGRRYYYRGKNDDREGGDPFGLVHASCVE